jgi:hypothetical protein
MRAQVFHDSRPELFERWLRHAAAISTRRNAGAPLVFANSWNEWAEGAHLEPDERTGRTYIEVVRRVVMSDGPEPTALKEPAWAGGTVGASPRGPLTELRPGLPDAIGRVGWVAASSSAGWIDSVDGRPLRDYAIEARLGSVIGLRGWSCADPRRSGRRDTSCYLVLMGDSDTWYAPIALRHRRPDLQRAMLARDRKTRRLVRAIDRLPPLVGRRILRLWAGRHDYFGFDLSLRLGSTPLGQYDVGFLELTTSGLRRVSTEFVLKVT